MQATYCALVVALRNLPNDPELEGAKLHLEKAIALSAQYQKEYYSIYWNRSPSWLKQQVRANCNRLAFGTYSHMIQLANCINQYAANKNAQGTSPTKSWQQLIATLMCAFDWIESQHKIEINYVQLALPIK